MKKVLICLFAFVLIVAMAFYIEPSWSDSGFDTSYGGSSSSSHSSSSHSSSSHSSSSRSRSSSSSSGSSVPGDPVETVIAVIFIIFILIGIFLIWPSSGSAKSNPVINDIYFDMDIHKLQNILPNETLDSLKEMAVNKFVEIQNAWMDFDYDTLKKCCTDELYNSYYEQLEVLKAKKQKNIMSDFKTIKICITDVVESEKFINVQVFLKIAFYDYIVNDKGEVLHGSKDTKIMNHYKLNFLRAKDVSVKNCSSCGAEITNPAAKVCPYCRSKIVFPPSQFVLSKKSNDGTIVL